MKNKMKFVQIIIINNENEIYHFYWWMETLG